MLGVFNLVMSVYIFGITLGTFGINFAVIRLVSEELAIKNIDNLKKITQKSIFLSLSCSIITSFIFLFFDDFIVQNCLHNKVKKNIVYLICCALPFISMSSSISGYFVAIRRTYKSTIIQFFEQIIKIIITGLILTAYLPKGTEFACFALILGDLISEIFSFIGNYIIYKIDLEKYKTTYTIQHKSFYYNKKIFTIATPIALTSLIRSGLSTLKQILIPLSFEKRNLDCAKALSIYGEINGMAMPIILFPNVIFASVSSLFVPEFATYKAQNRRKSIKKAVVITLLISIIFSCLISIFLFSFSKKLSIFIYHDENIAKYIRLLAPLTFFILVDTVIDNILKGLDAQNSVMIINIFDTLLDVILIYTIVPKFGIYGYLVSLFFSEIVNFVFSGLVLWKIIYKKKRE